MELSEKEEIRARTDLLELVSGYTTLHQRGRKYKGLCPFHQEKTPSFTVDADRGLWHCFGACSTGGDVFAFLMKAESLSFAEAAERLAERAGVKLARGRGNGDSVERPDERDRLYAVNALALRFFRESFARADIARDYAAKRGLVHETLEAFGIGFAAGGYTPGGWGPLARFLAQKSAGQPASQVLTDAEKAGLILRSRHDDSYIDKFFGRLIFPIHDVQERVVGFGGRLLLPAENAPKYVNSPETPIFSKSRILYALNRARKAIQEHGRVVVVEGYMDAVAAHQAGFPYVVATLGTSLTEEHVRLLHRYTRDVVLSFDADEAGVRAALRAAALFEATEGFTLRILALSPGEDPDSLLSRGDAAGFRRAINHALSVAEFRLRALETRYDTSGDEGKLAFLREAMSVLSEVRSPLERDLLLRRLAPYHPAFASGGPRVEESLRAELEGCLSRAPGRSPSMPVRLRGEIVLPPENRPPAAAPPRRTAAAAAERTLLRALLSDEWVDLVRGRLSPRDFPDQDAARLADALLPLVEGGIPPTKAIAELADRELADYARQITMTLEEEPLSGQAIGDCFRLLELRRHQSEMRQIQAQAAPNAEGMHAADDELLRRWQQKARVVEGARSAKSSPGETM